jgi:hypothetical protein
VIFKHTQIEIEIQGYIDASFAVHADMKSHSGNVIVAKDIIRVLSK